MTATILSIIAIALSIYSLAMLRGLERHLRQTSADAMALINGNKPEKIPSDVKLLLMLALFMAVMIVGLHLMHAWGHFQ